MLAAKCSALVAWALFASLGFTASTVTKEEIPVLSVARFNGVAARSRPSAQAIYSVDPTTAEGKNNPSVDKLIPRAPPFIMPGPHPVRLNIVVTLYNVVGSALIQRLIVQAFGDIDELSLRDPQGVVPEDGFHKEFKGYTFSIHAREGIEITWHIVRFAIVQVFAFMGANHYGLARIDIQNGHRIIGVGMISRK